MSNPHDGEPAPDAGQDAAHGGNHQANGGTAGATGGQTSGETLEAQLSEMKDRWMRALAEAENIRKRADRDRQEANQYAIAKFARDMLNVADNFARAINAVPKDTAIPEGLRGLVEGIVATEREMIGILERHGVKRVDPKAGDKFDPNLHQGIAEVPTPGMPTGAIVQVIQPGYTIAERLLRPAMVAVARAADPAPDGAPGSSVDVNA